MEAMIMTGNFSCWHHNMLIVACENFQCLTTLQQLWHLVTNKNNSSYFKVDTFGHAIIHWCWMVNIHPLWSQLGRCFNIMGWAWASSTFYWLYCYGTQIMADRNRVHDCLLSVKAATMATHVWSKLGHMHELSKLWVVKHGPYLKQL